MPPSRFALRASPKSRICGSECGSGAGVTDLEIAVLVDGKVARLEVAVDNPGRVDVLINRHGRARGAAKPHQQSAQDLVDEELDVLVGEHLGGDDGVHVRPHQLGHKIHARLGLVRRLPRPSRTWEGGATHRGDEEVFEPNHVVVHHVPQQPDLTERALRQRLVLRTSGRRQRAAPQPRTGCAAS